MCGIVACIGKKNTSEILLKGLKRLEYRGYDSAGCAMISNNKIKVIKEKGRVLELEKSIKENFLSGNIGISHTRWATHGEPNKKNAHPHFDCKKEIFLVHNGIIENYKTLKLWLEKKGHKFYSDTDTEVISHLIEENFQPKQDNNLLIAVQKALALVEGAYGLAIISSLEPDKLIVAKKGSPLVVGVLKKGEYIVASDPSAIIEYTRKVIYLDEGEIAVLSKKGCKITDMENRNIVKQVSDVSWDLSEIEKKGFDHFMLKEIFEQPESIKNCIRGRCLTKESRIQLGGIDDWIDFLKNVNGFVFLACGTSWHSGLIGEYLFEHLVGISCKTEYASEFRYKNTPINKQKAYFVLSQSGETADTLESLRKIKQSKANVFGIVNVVGSTIARESDAGIYIHAGPEIGVASTKAFTCQVVVLAQIAVLLGIKRGRIKPKEAKTRIKSISDIPKKIEQILTQNKQIKELSKKYYKFNNFLYLGREYNFPTALEGALKLKEISYIHAEGYPAAEMKHGPIALVDKTMPVIVVATDTVDDVYQKVVNNIEEVKARGGNVIAIATKGNKQIKKLVDEVIYVPKIDGFLTPVLNVVPLQLLAYYMAVLRGCDVDKPRNLAKSVTVE